MSDSNVIKLAQPGAFTDTLTEILRGGARALLTQAVEAEVAEFLAKHIDLKTETGQQRVVRHGHLPYVDDPLLARCLQCFDQIACVHMSGLFVRSHMNAGQDGFRDKSSKQNGDLIEGHWKMRNVPRRGSIDHTICSIILQVPASAQHGCR